MQRQSGRSQAASCRPGRGPSTAAASIAAPPRRQARGRCSGGSKFATTTTTAAAANPLHLLLLLGPGGRRQTVANAFAFGGGGGDDDESNDASPPPVRLIVYTKPDCPLCDGLKDRIEALIARAAFTPGAALAGAELEVRDISTNPDWQDDLHLSVPVLAARKRGGDGGGGDGGGGDAGDVDGGEIVLPRPQPRITADRLERHIEAALREAGLLP